MVVHNDYLPVGRHGRPYSSKQYGLEGVSSLKDFSPGYLLALPINGYWIGSWY